MEFNNFYFKLKKISKHLIVFFILTVSIIFPSFAEDKPATVVASSKINWITRDFSTKFTLSTKNANLKMPAGKKTAESIIDYQLPVLIQPSILCLYYDSNRNIEDKILEQELSLEQLYDFIGSGKKTPNIFTLDLKYLTTNNVLNINKLSKNMVRHSQPYTPNVPIDTVPSRKYTGIIIDARGANPVHGEYVDSETYPCFFPTVWDEDMEIVYEKNLADPYVVKEDGLVGYHYSDDSSYYFDRVGADPLYIKATEVYGRNRTDPIIKKKDALKILTIADNIKLMQEGKVVILLDKDNLIYNVQVPEKNPTYYVQFNNVKKHFYENKVLDITPTDTINGILFSVDLKFYPDSPELLPTEKVRIKAIADTQKELLEDNYYSILIEGHTADVGKPTGQLNLSIERTKTVMNALIDEGLDKDLFTYKGYGGTQPLASNENEEGRAQNRRVDITARPGPTYIQRDW